MLRRIISTAGAIGLLTVVGAGSAVAASGGNSNKGDVWLDNVGQPAGPGHEMDPHLACQNINLWGSGLADSSGTYEIDGWPPSGSKELDYSGTWSYDGSTGGDQVVAVIDVSKLMATAQANGDAAQNAQGYHFKLQFSQDPQKHKTFWVNCTSPSSPGGDTNGGGPTGPTPSGSTPGTTPPATSATAPATTPTSSVEGVSATRSPTKQVKKHHKRKHHKKHRKVKARRISRRPRAKDAPGFTG